MQPQARTLGVDDKPLSLAVQGAQPQRHLIHATLENGQTLLFRPYQKVWIAKWMSDDGSYIDQEKHGFAKELIVPGIYIIEMGADGPYTDSELTSKVTTVKTIPDSLPAA